MFGACEKNSIMDFLTIYVGTSLKAPFIPVITNCLSLWSEPQWTALYSGVKAASEDTSQIWSVRLHVATFFQLCVCVCASLATVMGLLLTWQFSVHTHIHTSQCLLWNRLTWLCPCSVKDFWKAQRCRSAKLFTMKKKMFPIFYVKSRRVVVATGT